MIKSMETMQNNFVVGKDTKLMMSKKEIRKEILRARDGLSEEERKRGAFLITERLLGHQWYYGSHKILAYAAFGSELSLDMLIEESIKNGKEVYLPRIEGEEMYFYPVKDLNELVSGYKGIREPELNASLRYQYNEEEAESTLLIMPGVAFDIYRDRLGYGKGFYDRFLADKPGLQLRSIAVAHKVQLLEEIPHEETDIRPYQVLTV